MRENKLIGCEVSDMERRLVLAIRNAASDEVELMRLAKQVGDLASTATKSRDSVLMAAVGRLLEELRAAASGAKHLRPMLEYKDCAAPLGVTVIPFETRRASRGAMEVTGYASTFGGPPDSYGDIIEKGAFAKSLSRHRTAGTLPKLFWSHDSSQVPGIWKGFREDSHGLVAEGLLAKTTLGKDLDELVAIGAVDALSIGFVIPPGGSRHDRDGIRIISQIDLHEVSLVSLPANPRARLTSGKQSASDKAYDGLVQSISRLRSISNLSDIEAGDDNVIDFPSKRSTQEHDVLDDLRSLERTIRYATRASR